MNNYETINIIQNMNCLLLPIRKNKTENGFYTEELKWF